MTAPACGYTVISLGKQASNILWNLIIILIISMMLNWYLVSMRHGPLLLGLYVFSTLFKVEQKKLLN